MGSVGSEQTRSQGSLLSVPAEGDPWERGCVDEEGVKVRRDGERGKPGKTFSQTISRSLQNKPKEEFLSSS